MEKNQPDGTKVLVAILLPNTDFWLKASEQSLNAIWGNPVDDVYAELLEESMAAGGNDEHVRRND